MIRAYAASEPGGELKPFEYDPGPLRPEQVEIDVDYCGICHSDLSMLDNDWQMTSYPIVPGHEVVGRISAVGDAVRSRKVGEAVGLGWFSESCRACRECLGGRHNLCASNEQTIVGRHGGFANKVRCDALWAVPLPEQVDAAAAGPLFCGGITVFSPLVAFDVRPTDSVGVIGVGGLGHLALQFLSRWGCEVTAFTSTPDKAQAARQFGAHDVVNSRDAGALERQAGRYDLIISTVNVPLPWEQYIGALRPGGRLHLVGAVLEPIPVVAFSLIGGQKQVSGSPLGTPATVAQMLDFCALHGIAPACETFALDDCNAALRHLREGKPRYRIVLKA